jgi:hypothetical protein
VDDNGSAEGTLNMLPAWQALTVTARNISFAWNKNRPLFLVSSLLRSYIVVPREGDAYPPVKHKEIE